MVIPGLQVTAFLIKILGQSKWQVTFYLRGSFSRLFSFPGPPDSDDEVAARPDALSVLTAGIHLVSSILDMAQLVRRVAGRDPA